MTTAEAVAMAVAYGTPDNPKDVWAECLKHRDADKQYTNGVYRFEFTDGSAVNISEEDWWLDPKESPVDTVTDQRIPGPDKSKFVFHERWLDDGYECEARHTFYFKHRTDAHAVADTLQYEAGLCDWDDYWLDVFEGSAKVRSLSTKAKEDDT